MRRKQNWEGVWGAIGAYGWFHFVQMISSGGEGGGMWSTVRPKHLWPSYARVQVARLRRPRCGSIIFFFTVHFLRHYPAACNCSTWVPLVSCIHFCLVQFRLQMSNKATKGNEDCKSLRLCELSCLISVYYTCYDFSTLILGKTSAKGMYSRFGQNLQAYIFH